MYLTRIDDIQGDDYEAHQHVRKFFEKQKVLFQRKGHEIVVFSEKPVKGSEDVRTTLYEIEVGSKLLFKLRVNACVTKFVDGKNRRVALPRGGIREWLEKTFEKHGFTADFVYHNEGIRRSLKGATQISLSCVMATGILTVTDPERLKSAVRTGIGHAKGLGCGFLNVFDVM